MTKTRKMVPLAEALATLAEFAEEVATLNAKEQAVIEAAEAIMLLPAPLLSTACMEWANLEDAVEALQKLKEGAQ